MNLNRVNIFFFRPYIGFRRHLQQNSTECRIKVTGNHQSQSIHQCFVFRQRTAFRQCLTIGINGAMIQGLSSFPTGKLIFICRQQSGQFLLAVRIVQGNRCREVTQQRRDNRLINAAQHKSLLGFGQYQNRLFHPFALIFKLNRFAFFVQQTSFDRNHHRLFVRHIGRSRNGLFDRQFKRTIFQTALSI